MGHSLGGATALQFCHDDVRCKAGIDLDGAPLGNVTADGVRQPFMFLLGDHTGESDAPQVRAKIDAILQTVYRRIGGCSLQLVGPVTLGLATMELF